MDFWIISTYKYWILIKFDNNLFFKGIEAPFRISFLLIFHAINKCL